MIVVRLLDAIPDYPVACEIIDKEMKKKGKNEK